MKKAGSALTFQYPLRVEVGCNRNNFGMTRSPSPFQYPLRVEVGCNFGGGKTSLAVWLGFSTLYGSKWVATLPILAYSKQT